MRRLALALALLCSGCLQGVPDDLGCIGDDTCPTGYYCSNDSICVTLADGTPPKLVFGGVGTEAGAATGNSLTVPRSGLSFYLSFSNSGTHDANSVSVGLDGPACADLHSPGAVPALPAGAGESVNAISMNPVLPCPDADVGVTLDVAQGNSVMPFHRTTTATFRLHVGP